MADINSNQILEVPDTPDRIQRSTCPVSGSVVRDVTMAAANPIQCRRIRIKTRSSSLHGSSSQDNACSVLPAPSDTDHIFKQAEVARILALSENLEAKSSLQKSDRTEISVENEKRTEKRGLDQSSSISDYISCSVTGGRSPGCGVRDRVVSEQDGNLRNVSFLGEGSGLRTIPVGKPQNRTSTSTTNRLKGVAGADVSLGSSSREVKGDVVTNKAIAGSSSPPCSFPQRHVGQKKLVRNGCISPSNIVKRSVKADEKQEICSKSGHLHHPHPQLDSNVIDLTDNSPIMTRQRYAVNDKLSSGYNRDTRVAKKLRTDRAGKTLIPQSMYHVNSSNCSEVSLSSRNNKGKEIRSDILDIDEIGEANLRRVSLSAAETSSVVNNNSSNMDAEQGWRKTHNYTSKLPISLMGKLSCISERESGSSAPSSQEHGSGATIMASDGVGNKTIMTSRRWRKHGTTSSHPGESSSACVEPGASFVSSSKIIAGRNHSSHRLDHPVITIDDTPPEGRPSSSGYSNGMTSADPSVQAQLESDELLARQLQEQLYNESPRFAHTEEIDAIVAMSLQHEEDTHHTSRPVRRYPNNTRGARASRLSAIRAELAAANSMLSRLRNTAPITLGLGAIARYPAASHIQPNIDLNDYDALLALDENNHQHTGASENQINNLPQSVIQSNSIEEPCAVCLESPSVGDTIRHLPCFHKFHKECIDEWLRRKKLCPICKSGIR